MVLSSDIVDQRILQSDWTSGTPGHIEPRVLVSDDTFPWWLSPSKKYVIIWLFPEILTSKESCYLIGGEEPAMPKQK